MSDDTFGETPAPGSNSIFSSNCARPSNSAQLTSSDPAAESWWEFIVAAEESRDNGVHQSADEDRLAAIAAHLVELGAYGVVEGEVNGAGWVSGASPDNCVQNNGPDFKPNVQTSLFTAYFCSPDQSTAEAMIIRAGCRIIRFRRITDSDWLTPIRSQFPPITILGLKIIPVLTEEEANLVQTDTAYMASDLKAGITPCVLIPGCGFGSGHHPTTHSLIELLQDPMVTSQNPRSILDFGCGSGVLTIAAAKLFPATIVAVDNDLLAMDNTKVNLRINNLCDRVVAREHLNEVSGKFDLILANIYLEVLDAYASQLSHLARDNAFILISGIRPEEAPKLLSRFKGESLILEKCLVTGNRETAKVEGSSLDMPHRRRSNHEELHGKQSSSSQECLSQEWWSGLFRRISSSAHN